MRDLREIWKGGDGLSWRDRRHEYVWRRLDFLSAFPDRGQAYLIDHEPLWRELSLLGYPAPAFFRYHFGDYYARNAWLPGACPRFHSPGQMLRACEALLPAFASGILHGDLSPENILLLPSGDFQWIDWLSACREGNQCARGKKAYLAPERAVSAYCTLQSELYALGKILEYWVRGSHYEPMMRPLIAAATHALPQRRPASLQDFLARLRDAIKEQPFA